MNRTLSTILLTTLCAIGSLQAQEKITVAEPEFAEETILLTSDSTGVLLIREDATIKTKAGASLYLTGIGKVKSRLTLKGVRSLNHTRTDAPARLIVKAMDNRTDPHSFINIFKFTRKGKERRYQLAESGTLSKTEQNNLSSVNYQAKKFGDSSYYIVLEDATSGEYGIVFGDPNSVNTKNNLKITTFSIR